jgi:hypothetical protein
MATTSSKKKKKKGVADEVGLLWAPEPGEPSVVDEAGWMP